ncbi:hypothetical protein C8R45DRAFT_1065871 [Mycena sanguinolenta]|nr:hypothetical protein C8R45DRAFT_1065871 [Mycena sanguinolenta]
MPPATIEEHKADIGMSFSYLESFAHSFLARTCAWETPVNAEKERLEKIKGELQPECEQPHHLLSDPTIHVRIWSVVLNCVQLPLPFPIANRHEPRVPPLRAQLTKPHFPARQFSRHLNQGDSITDVNSNAGNKSTLLEALFEKNEGDAALVDALFPEVPLARQLTCRQCGRAVGREVLFRVSLQGVKSNLERDPEMSQRSEEEEV